MLCTVQVHYRWALAGYMGSSGQSGTSVTWCGCSDRFPAVRVCQLGGWGKLCHAHSATISSVAFSWGYISRTRSFLTMRQDAYSARTSPKQQINLPGRCSATWIWRSAAALHLYAKKALFFAYDVFRDRLAACISVTCPGKAVDEWGCKQENSLFCRQERASPTTSTGTGANTSIY